MSIITIDMWNKLKAENTILREALEEISRGDTICKSWRDTRLPQCDKIAQEALQRAGL